MIVLDDGKENLPLVLLTLLYISLPSYLEEDHEYHDVAAFTGVLKKENFTSSSADVLCAFLAKYI